jgi:dynein heavy chain
LWQKQLRYYWEEVQASAVNPSSDDCIVKQVNSSFIYGYEYIDATSRLVITLLTDRCWIIITGALHIKLGAALAAPTGKGKTESTKDLAKGLGMQYVVFNCSEQITNEITGKFSLAWLRLVHGLANMSSIALISKYCQLFPNSCKQLESPDWGRRDFRLRGKPDPIIENFGVFITMKPGYAGRTELPDNLKVLFRPVSMMIPSYRLIAEIMLFAEGFLGARYLSQKMVRLYKLSSE